MLNAKIIPITKKEVQMPLGFMYAGFFCLFRT